MRLSLLRFLQLTTSSMISTTIRKRLFSTSRISLAPAPSNAALRKTPATPSSLSSLSSSGWTLTETNSTSGHGEVEQVRSTLSQEFLFKDFSQAWGFMSRVALQAEKLNVSRPFLCAECSVYMLIIIKRE